MPATVLLSAFYFGSVAHYALMARSTQVVIDLGEHYQRQSYRTRTRIVGPNGTQDLLVPTARRSGEKMPMHTVGLSYAEPWNRQHLQALRSAYGQTPWFIHYIDDLEDLLATHHARLIDLDLATMRLAMKWLGITTPVEVCETYVEDPGALIDLRDSLHPKRLLPSVVPHLPPYMQVFSERHGFMDRLCIIDLVMNLGPGARQALGV